VEYVLHTTAPARLLPTSTAAAALPGTAAAGPAQARQPGFQQPPQQERHSWQQQSDAPIFPEAALPAHAPPKLERLSAILEASASAWAHRHPRFQAWQPLRTLAAGVPAWRAHFEAAAGQELFTLLNTYNATPTAAKRLAYLTSQRAVPVPTLLEVLAMDESAFEAAHPRYNPDAVRAERTRRREARAAQVAAQQAARKAAWAAKRPWLGQGALRAEEVQQLRGDAQDALTNGRLELLQSLAHKHE
jgi:hypothetical protein